MKKIILLIVLFGFNHEIFGQTSVEITPGYVNSKAIVPYSTFYSSGVYKGYIGIFNNTNSIDVGTGNTNITGDLNLVIAASPRATLKSNGNFGIGTSNPLSKLHVLGNSIISDNTVIDPDIFPNTAISGGIADGSGWALTSGIGGKGSATLGSTWALGHNGGSFYIGVGNNVADNTIQTGIQIEPNRNVLLVPTSGFVGIGTATPNYKLHILNSGSLGILNKSSSSFCVLDIDSFTGDAALRLANNGVNQWNIRNEPGTDNLQIFELGGGGERFRIGNTTGKGVFNNDLEVVGNLSKGGGSFKIDHPLDPENKFLYHSFIESPDMMNIYNGNVVTDETGKATITMPEYFQALNIDFRYQLTVLGTFSQAMISKEIQNNVFEISTEKSNVKVSWQVTGIRNDAFARKNRIPTVEVKSNAERGKYLHPEAFDKSKNLKIGLSNDVGEKSSISN